MYHQLHKICRETIYRIKIFRANLEKFAQNILCSSQKLPAPKSMGAGDCIMPLEWKVTSVTKFAWFLLAKSHELDLVEPLPSTNLAWVTLPGAVAPASIALRVQVTHKPPRYDKVTVQVETTSQQCRSRCLMAKQKIIYREFTDSL